MYNTKRSVFDSKYIVGEMPGPSHRTRVLSGIIFPNYLSHADFQHVFLSISSAGYVAIQVDPVTAKVQARCFAESPELHIKSQPERDQVILNALLSAGKV